APAAAAASDDERREERRRQRRLQAIEAEIARLEAELRGLEAEITSAGERGDVAAVSRLGARHASLNDELAARYDEWAAAA
ncbi:MAG: ABC transporter ATP-binding protein, partial [Chloroflexi bacterium]|nr:ABC transporter ATP-binding protein [Chloroflexota bacterium]